MRRYQIEIHKSLKYLEAAIVDTHSSRTRFSCKIAKSADSDQAIARTLVDFLTRHKIAAVAFNRKAYRYHGHLKNIAELIRKQGIKI